MWDSEFFRVDHHAEEGGLCNALQALASAQRIGTTEDVSLCVSDLEAFVINTERPAIRRRAQRAIDAGRTTPPSNRHEIGSLVTRL